MKKDFSLQQGKKIAIKQKNQVQWCDISRITHLKCDSYITTLYHLDNEPLTVSRLLKEFEQELEDYGFIRVNRSTLVNMAYLKSYNGGSTRTLELTTGEIIPVSRRNVYKIKEYLLLA